jgi:pimeloyl-ACP methyl ester carboxylesterase
MARPCGSRDRDAMGRLVLIPGLGADAQLFSAVRHLAPVIPPWLPVDGGDLASYARRYVEAGWVKAGDALGGSSFGGMLAQEIARLLPLRCLLLITTCRSREGISPGLRVLAPLSRVVPVVHEPASFIAKILDLKLGGTKPAHRRVIESWVRHGEPRYLRWAARTAGAWRGITLPPGLPVFQIHGGHDRLMPASRSGADTIVPGAGHLLPITHPAAFRSWLERSLAAVA